MLRVEDIRHAEIQIVRFQFIRGLLFLFFIDVMDRFCGEDHLRN